jgi:hypothetical protein
MCNDSKDDMVEDETWVEENKDCIRCNARALS